MRAPTCFLTLVACLLIAGCGGGEEPTDNAVEATERNTVELGDLTYRVNLFRQLNPRIAPDDAIYDGPPAGDGQGFYAAFLRVCNETDSSVAPTGAVSLEDAFGDGFRRVDLGEDNEFAYSSRPLQPGECLPEENTAASRTVEGATVLFEVPLDQIDDRPFVLELGEGDERRRIQLDL